jgi:hypothetical protein
MKLLYEKCRGKKDSVGNAIHDHPDSDELFSQNIAADRGLLFEVGVDQHEDEVGHQDADYHESEYF